MRIFVSARLHATAAPDAPEPMISTSTFSFIRRFLNSRITPPRTLARLHRPVAMADLWHAAIERQMRMHPQPRLAGLMEHHGRAAWAVELRPIQTKPSAGPRHYHHRHAAVIRCQDTR